MLAYAKLNAITVEMSGQLRALGIYKIPIESYVEKKEDSMRDELLRPEPWEEEIQ